MAGFSVRLESNVSFFSSIMWTFPLAWPNADQHSINLRELGQAEQPDPRSQPPSIPIGAVACVSLHMQVHVVSAFLHPGKIFAAN